MNSSTGVSAALVSAVAREAVYDGVFGTPKTEAGSRQIPLSDTALDLVGQWKAQVENTGADALVFATRLGTSISPTIVHRPEGVRAVTA